MSASDRPQTFPAARGFGGLRRLDFKIAGFGFLLKS